MGGELTRFVGREREIVGLAEELRQGVRLLNLTAPSGMGKTRLAREILARVEPHFADAGGAWFCSLVSARTRLDLESEVAHCLGIRGQGAPLAQTIARRGRLLLVLDNLESVRDAGPLLRSWLNEAPELQILGTSLIPLEISGETIFELDALDHADAVALYLDRTRANQARRPFSQSDREAIDDLVRRLDGIPLAIELAAARVRILPPQQLLARIDERFLLLRSRVGDRQVSLRQAIALTWDLLSEEERDALQQLSIFAGSFSLEAAEAVLATETPAFDLLDDLRAKAMLQLEGDERFSLYESVRAFALEQLEARGGHEAIERRHCAYYLRRAEGEAQRADGPEAPEAIRWLLDERDNLLAAYRRCLAPESTEARVANGGSMAPEGPAKRPEEAIRLGFALAVIFALQAPPDAEEELLLGIVRAAKQVDSPLCLSRALFTRGFARRRRGVLDDAAKDLRLSAEAARRAGDVEREVFARSTLAEVLARRGEGEAARAELSWVRDRLSSASDPLLLPFAKMMEGVSHVHWGAHEEAVGALQAALPHLRRLGHLRHEASTLLNLGVAWTNQGRFAEARGALDEARRVFARLGDTVSDAVAVVNQAAIFGNAGDLEAAERAAIEGLSRLRKLGNRRVEAVALANLGLIALERSQAQLAEERLVEAADLLHGQGEKRLGAVFLAFASVAEALQGKIDAARTSFTSASRQLAEVGERSRNALLGPLGALVDLAAAAQADVAEAKRVEDAARSRLAEARRLVPTGATTGAFNVAIRLLREALDRREGAERPVERAQKGLHVGPEASWFAMDDGERVDMQRRVALRRILHTLVEQRLIAPGVGIDRDELARIGWPGERILAQAARNRIRSAISTLRSLGLAGALQHHAGGYLIDPGLPVIRHGERI